MQQIEETAYFMYPATSYKRGYLVLLPAFDGGCVTCQEIEMIQTSTSQSKLRRSVSGTHLKPPTASQTGIQDTMFRIIKIISVLSKFS